MLCFLATHPAKKIFKNFVFVYILDAIMVQLGMESIFPYYK